MSHPFLSRFLLLSCVASTLLIRPAQSAEADNFNDNTIGNEWTAVIDDPTKLSVNETNQRLEITANAPTDPNLDAVYLSNGSSGFRLSTSQNFQISIAYNFSAATATGGSGSALALDFGVGRDLDGTDSATIAYGYANLGGNVFTQLGAAYRTNDQQTDQSLGFGTGSGIFRISYDAAGDDLTLGVASGASYVLNDTVKTVWGADSLFVSFGARGNGFSVTGNNAYLDNFSVDSGVLTAVPEPSTTALLVCGVGAGLFLLRRRFSRSIL